MHRVRQGPEARCNRVVSICYRLNMEHHSFASHHLYQQQWQLVAISVYQSGILQKIYLPTHPRSQWLKTTSTRSIKYRLNWLELFFETSHINLNLDQRIIYWCQIKLMKSVYNLLFSQEIRRTCSVSITHECHVRIYFCTVVNIPMVKSNYMFKV